MMMKRPMMKKGGSLKPVNPKTQKGLSKLPKKEIKWVICKTVVR